MNLDIGLMTFDLQGVPAYARRAEEMGFGAIWSAETRHDPYPPAGGRVHHHQPDRPRHRDRGRVPAQPDGAGSYRLGSAAGRRFSLGLGSQVKAHNERRFSVAWEPPGPRTPFFSPGPIAHPQIPVYLAGVNPQMCRIASEVAHGLHIHSFHSARYLRDCVHPAGSTGSRISCRACT